MEKENEIVQFSVLEERLNKILEGYTTLREEREKLISQMHANEEEVEKLRNEVTTLTNERSEVRERIERLIKRLEGIPLE
jgi:predicted  nucleic acid-binding Zn-ribbon protein